MKYRELIEKYMEGQLEPEECEQVEAEIEKYEAISDYLYEEGGVDDIVIQAEEKQENAADTEFVRIINRSIRRAFMKLGVGVTAIVLAVVLFCIYGLSPIVSSFYYNPGKEIAEFTNQMSLDWEVYSELTMPGLKRDSVSVVDKGYGKYNITIDQTWSQDGKFINVPGEINRGKMVLYDVNTLKQPTGNAFASAAIEGEGTLTELYEKQPENILSWAAGKKEHAEEQLRDLEENEKYIGYVSFEEDLNFEELMTFLKEIEYEEPEWCGVKTSEEGYSDGRYGYTMQIAGMDNAGEDEKKYPNLDVMSGADDRYEYVEDEEWCKTHFQSMLKYLRDQKEFSKMVDINWYDFDEAINFVEENGLNYYGIAVVTTKETLLKINEHEKVFGIYTVPMP